MIGQEIYFNCDDNILSNALREIENQKNVVALDLFKNQLGQPD